MDLTALPNGEINEFHPLALVAGAYANPNILSHRDAMKATDRDQFLQAMEEEIERPCSCISTCQKVLCTVWSHERKTKPTGEVYIRRSHICADGSRQTFGINYNKTYSPVAQWSTAFPQAPLENEEVFIEIPAGFYNKDSDSTKD
eukprot:7842959-Ditylum_brightwellii.AAC.1